jgi:hypothetical protein
MMTSARRITPPRTRRRAGLVSALLAVVLLLTPAAAIADSDAADAADAAARWLVDQLVDDERLEVAWQDADGAAQVFADHGGTADVVFALAATGVAPETAVSALDWLVGEAGVYTGAAFGSPSAGATAKLVLAALTDGRDPRAVADLDLVAQLTELERGDGPDAGRFADAGEEDWSSTFTQAIAILALVRADGVSPSDAATDFLVSQQCDDGGFRFEPGAQPCTGHVDTTALAIQAQLATGTDASAAVAWLIDRQGDDGGFGNANTTGLAAAALAIAGEHDTAAAARANLVGLQDHCDAGTGAIGFDHDCAGDPVFATRQAVLGLTGASLLDVSIGGAPSAAGGVRPAWLAAVIVAGLAIGLVARHRSRG